MNAENFWLWDCPASPRKHYFSDDDCESNVSESENPPPEKKTKISDTYTSTLGRLRLQKHSLQSSLPSALFGWTQGLPNFVGMDSSNRMYILGQLTKSRVMEGTEPVQAVNCPLNPNLSILNFSNLNNDCWFRTVMDTGDGLKLKCNLMEKFIIIKEPSSNTRHFYIPNPHIWGFPFTLKYSILDDERSHWKWRSIDVWYPIPHQLKMEETAKGTQVMKVPCTLFVLQSTTLVLYDFDTGKKFQEFDLSYRGQPPPPGFHYNSITVNSEEGRIYISAPQSSARLTRDGSLQFEILVLSYPPLTLIQRILIPKSGPLTFSKNFEVYGRLFQLFKSSHIEMMDFDNLVDLNTATPVASSQLEIVEIQKAGICLKSLKSEDNYLVIVPGSWPPHAIVKNNGMYELKRLEVGSYDLKKVEKGNVGSSSFATSIFGHFPTKTPLGNVSISLIDINQPILMVSGFHGFEIIHLDVQTHKSSILFNTRDFKSEFFPTPQVEQKPSLSDLNLVNLAPRRQGLRQIARKSYVESEMRFGLGYEEELQMLCVCMVEHEVLYAIIYENKFIQKGEDLKFKKLRSLPPVKLTKPPKVQEMGCSEIYVHYNQWFLSIKLNLFDVASAASSNFTELYTINLYGESQ